MEAPHIDCGSDLSRLVRRLALTALATLCLGRLAACDSPTEVGISSVRITPDSADLVAGEETRLQATVLNTRNETMPEAVPQWSSRDPAIATVNAEGLVIGRAAGVVDILAELGGSTGTARIHVLPEPVIVLSENRVALRAGAGGPAPEARTISVRNGGGGTVGELSLRVFHPAGTRTWLTADLAAAAAPTTLTLTPTTEGLAAGILTATVEIASARAGMQPASIDVTLMLTDVVVQETDGATVVSEAAGTDEVLVSLSAQPAATVVVVLESDESLVATSPQRLTFTPDDWETPQSVSLTGVDDDAVDGDQVATLSLAVDAEASDDAFGGVPVRELEVRIRDDDRAGLVVTESDGSTSVHEGGRTDDVRVALAAQPLSNVVVRVTSDTPSEVTVEPATLTFTPSDWRAPKSVTVRAVDDTRVDGTGRSTLTFRVDAVASDDAFDDVADERVTVTAADDDVASLVVSESGGSTYVDEAGASDQVSVVLNVRPASDVVVTASIDRRSEVSVAPTRLTFNPATWSAPQLITVTGVDDGVMDGAQVSALTVAVDVAASDPQFGSASSVRVDVITVDDEAVGVSSATPTSHPDVPADALVASYDLTTLTSEGLLRDFSGRGLHGSISGTTVTDAPRGGGRLFQVATDRIELPPRSDFDLDGPLSIVARFRMDVPRQHQHVVACDDKFALAIREADQVRLSNTRGDLAETLEPLSADVWHSVIGVFRGTVGDVLDDSNIEIWIDGVRMPIAVRNATGRPPVVWRDGVLWPTDACYIGFESHQGEPNHQNLAFHGAIDELLVFGRALTWDEIRLLAAP